MTPDPLAHVKRVARRKRATDKEYRGALAAAHDSGHSFAQIAEAAEVSRQAVRQLLGRVKS